MSVIAGDAFLGVLFKISLMEHNYTLLNGGVHITNTHPMTA